MSPRPIKDTRPPLWRRPLFVVLAIVLVVVIVGGTAILVSGSGGSNGTTPGGFALTATIVLSPSAEEIRSDADLMERISAATQSSPRNRSEPEVITEGLLDG